MNSCNLTNDGRQTILSRLYPFIGWKGNTNMFTTSYSKMSNKFSVIAFVALSTLKLVNDNWCKNLGNRVFFILLLDFCILVLVRSDIVAYSPKKRRTNRRHFFSTVGAFSLRIWNLLKNNLKHLSMKFSG